MRKYFIIVLGLGLVLFSITQTVLLTSKISKTKNYNTPTSFSKGNFSKGTFKRETFKRGTFKNGSFSSQSNKSNQSRNEIPYYEIIIFYALLLGVLFVMFGIFFNKYGWLAMKKYLPETSFIIGAMMIVYNLLHYKYLRVGGTTGTYFYLAEVYVIGLVVGIGLFLIGTLVLIRFKKDK